ncbi:ComF family protein [Psychrobacter sp. AOP22-C1-22]|uniref:ComF family protein n=1 Tax=unclassified Psychrobacter TaxID=196806 RepID=UPI0017882121|nr:ComF family protein [Psychrobacter sp. FME6]MBE0407894.1 ComF family protein [Psychrobacter sp. FME6]MBE0446260.1 ComF family protein [Psychrobacter sp. FME5]
MRHLAPYQTGLWLAEYGDIRCQLCRVYRSTPQYQLPQLSQLSQQHLPSHSADILNVTSSIRPSNSVRLPSNNTYVTKLRLYINRRLSSGLLCAHCHHSMVWLPKPFDVDIAAGTALTIQTATYYDYPMRQAIRAFKHHEDMTKLPLLLHALRQLPRPHGCHHDNSVIVAMPTTNQRLVKRGFDPVSILSAQLSKHWQIPLWHGIKRIDNTISQQGLTRAERLSNLDNAFALIETPPVKRLLFFDDVSTTGASLQALARTLYVSSDITSSINTQALHKYHLFAYALAHGSQS